MDDVKKYTPPAADQATASPRTELRSEHVQDILGLIPNWMIRWGITLIFAILIGILMMAYFIKYPDVIEARISFTTENPPIRVMTKTDGKVNRMFFQDFEKVEKNQIIAILDNPASLTDIEKIEVILKEIDLEKDRAIFEKIAKLDRLNLGDIQIPFAALIQKLNDFQFFSSKKDIAEKILSTQSQIKKIRGLNANIKTRGKTLTREVDLAEKDFNRSVALNKNGLISDVELEKTETEFLQYKRQLDNLTGQLLNNEVTAEQLKSQIIELRQSKITGQTERKLSIHRDIKSLKNAIERWKEKFLITAPISGEISFMKNLTEQQFVNINEQILTVIPLEGVGKIIGRAVLPITNSGKVKVDQQVNISLDGYPFQEFGMIKSNIKSISAIPQDEVYVVEIIPDSLFTTYGKTIPFRQEMPGTAKIITENRSVFQRVFDRLNSALKNS